MQTTIANRFFEQDLKKKSGSPFLDKPIPIEVNDEKLEKFYFVADTQSSVAYAEIHKSSGEMRKVSGKELVKLLKSIDSGEVVKMDDEEVTPMFFIEGVASSCNEDLQGDRMSFEALKTMVSSAQIGDIPLRNAHSNEWDSEMGKLVDVWLEGEGDGAMMHTKYKLNDFSVDPFAKKLWYLINDGATIGLSIGGIVDAYHIDNSENDDDYSWGKVVFDAITLIEVSVTKNPANQDTFIDAVGKSLQKSLESIGKAKWDAAYVNNLPDAAFAIIQAGGEKDDEGKTKPRSLRKLPHHNSSVKSPTENSSVDLPHLRNALARLSQTDLTSAQMSRAKSHLNAHAKALGVGTDNKSIESDEELCKAIGQTPQSIAGKIFHDIISLDEEQLGDFLNLFKSLDMNKTVTKDDQVVDPAEVTETLAEAATGDEVETPAEEVAETPSEVVEEPAKDEVEAAPEEAATVDEAPAEVEEEVVTEEVVTPEVPEVPAEAEKSLGEVFKKLEDLQAEIALLKKSAPKYKKVSDTVVTEKSEEVSKKTIKGSDINKSISTGRKWFANDKEYTLEEARAEMDRCDAFKAAKSTRQTVVSLFR